MIKFIRQKLNGKGHKEKHREHITPRVLFILKRREDFHCDPSYSGDGLSTGLLNSATFVSDMLIQYGIESKVAVVIDNNDIDREVTAFNPTHVIIEALWVVPEKFDVLIPLHPKVKWVIRYHSEVSFIASEGIAMGWTMGYLKRPSLVLASNSPRFKKELESIAKSAGYSHKVIEDRIIYLPNYYPIADAPPHPYSREKAVGYVDIGCFGAIRPLKNQLIQAMAALQFANRIRQKLRFHINMGRTEMKGEPILHNIKGLFDGMKDQGHELVLHDWMKHEDFLEVLKTMDIGMQVTFSETFNIVAADMIRSYVPVVVSEEVPWAVHGISNADESDSIAQALYDVHMSRSFNVMANARSLKEYVEAAKDYWIDYLTDVD
jgi:hypothetical protein